MPFIPVSPLVVKASMEYTYQGDILVNTMWFEKTDEEQFNTDTMELLSNGIENWLREHLMPLLSNDLTCDRIYITRHATTTDLFYENIPPLLDGEVVGEGLPANVACCVKYASNITGRSYRGRNFIGGLPDSVVDAGFFTTVFKSSLMSAYEELPALITAEVAAQHVVVSKYSGGAARASAVTVPVATYSIRKQKVNTMRTRVN